MLIAPLSPIWMLLFSQSLISLFLTVYPFRGSVVFLSSSTTIVSLPNPVITPCKDDPLKLPAERLSFMLPPA